MKIAILGIKTLPAYGGTDRVVEKLLEHLTTEDDYYVYLTSDNKVKLTLSENIHLILIPYIKGKHIGAFSYFLLCTLHYLFIGRYDIAHIHNSDFGLFCALLKLKRRVKVIGTFHGNPYERKKWGRFAQYYLRLSESFFLRYCDRLTSVSKRKNASKNNIVYIPNGMENTNNLVGKSNFPYESYCLVKGDYILFACGRLDSTKGLHLLLNAYLEDGIKNKLLVVGDFNHDADYSMRIENLKSDYPNIILHKSLLDKNTLIDVILNCKIFVFPSEIEAMSMMLLEVISCRKLVVCSNISENVEIVGEDYKYLFSLQKKGDLKQKLLSALEDKNYEPYIEELYRLCYSKYNWNTIAEKYREIYISTMLGLNS